MPEITVDLIHNELNDLPNGVKVPLPELLQRADRLGLRSIFEAIMFGKPDYVVRIGDDFTATATITEPKRFGPILVHASKLVRFTLRKVGQELQVTNVRGVTVELPIVGELAVNWFNARVERGKFKVNSRKLFVPVALTIDPKTGDISLF